MLASSNVEGASRMSTLQGNAHDPWDEDERQKIYLIPIAWRKRKKIKHVEIAIQVKEEAKHLLDQDLLKISSM